MLQKIGHERHAQGSVTRGCVCVFGAVKQIEPKGRDVEWNVYQEAWRAYGRLALCMARLAWRCVAGRVEAV